MYSGYCRKFRIDRDKMFESKKFSKFMIHHGVATTTGRKKRRNFCTRFLNLSVSTIWAYREFSTTVSDFERVSRNHGDDDCVHEVLTVPKEDIVFVYFTQVRVCAS